MASYIRFDWAMKRLLRDKANFSVLEGLITTLLGEKITICKSLRKSWRWKREALDITRKLKSKGISSVNISEFTGIPMNEIDRM